HKRHTAIALTTMTRADQEAIGLTLTSQLLPPLDHQRGPRVAPLEAATGPRPGAGPPQPRLLPRHRLLDRRRPRTGLKPPRSTAIRILNSTRNSEAPLGPVWSNHRAK